MTVTAINKLVDKALSQNHKTLEDGLLAGTDNTMTAEKVYSIMITNCLALSTKISVQIIMTFLNDSGIMRLDEREIAKLLLKQLSSEITE